MLLIFTVLAFFLAIVASNNALDDDVKEAFEELNSYGGKLVWSDELAEEALEYLSSPDNVEADLKIGEKITTRKNDPTPLGMKIYNAFSELFETRRTEISALPKGSQYGCNYENSSSNGENVLKIVCLYNRNSH